MKKIRALIKYIMLPVFILVMFIPATMATASASSYSSWVQDTEAYQDFYDNASLVERETLQTAQPGEESFLVQQIGNLIYWLGATAQGALESGSINLTIDGVVFGKLAQPSGISYTSFDLSDGNIYGTIGATIYTYFRGFTYSMLFILFLFLLAKALFYSTPKSKEDLKEGIWSIIISFALIYLMPLIADAVLFLRDQFMYWIASRMLGDGNSILDSMLLMYETDPSLIRAVVYLATVGATFVYIKDYVSVAIQQTILFGFFCIFNVLGAWKKKFLSDWTAMFFSNMLIPVIDIVCLLLPFIAIDKLTPENGNISFGGACIVMFMIWTARTSRSQIMRLFGSFTGTPAGRGFPGLGMMGMQMMSAMARSASSGFRNLEAFRGRSNEESFNSWREEAEKQKDTSDAMNRQAGDIMRDLPSLDSLDDDRFERNLTNNDFTDEELGVGSGFSGSLEDELGRNMSDNTELGENALAEMPISDTGLESTDNVGMESAQMPAMDDSSMAAGIQQLDGAPSLEDISEDRNFASTISPAEDISQPIDLPPMSDFEKSRYSNLQAMDSLQANINSDKEQLRTIESDTGIADKRAEVQRLEQQSASIDRDMQFHKQNIDDMNTTLTDKSVSRQQLSELQVQRRENAEKLQAARLDLESAERTQSERTNAIRTCIAGNEEHLQQRMSAERQFAQVSKDHGRDGSRYASAKDMRLAMDTRNIHNQRALEAARHKANMSISDLRGLSPETAAQIAEIQKDNVRKANLRRAAGKVGGAIAGTAVNTVGAVAATIGAGTAGLVAASATAYAGDSASSDAFKQGAMLGAGLGYGAVKGTAKVVKGTAVGAKKVVDNRHEIAANVKAGIETTKKIGGSAVDAVQTVQNHINQKKAPQRKSFKDVQASQQSASNHSFTNKNANIAANEIRRNRNLEAQASQESARDNSFTNKNVNIATAEIKRNQDLDT